MKINQIMLNKMTFQCQFNYNTKINKLKVSLTLKFKMPFLNF